MRSIAVFVVLAVSACFAPVGEQGDGGAGGGAAGGSGGGGAGTAGGGGTAGGSATGGGSSAGGSGTGGGSPQCGGANVCSIELDCNLGTTTCEPRDPDSGAGCCVSCPVVAVDCVLGSHPAPSGIDPFTGCEQKTCVRDDQVCPAVYAPVCSTTGQTYGNPCELSNAGATLLHPGECVRGEGLDCGLNGMNQCGTSGELYCRDACPTCDAWIMRCTKVGVCVTALDCPAGARPPVCPNGNVATASCVMSECQYSCP